MIVIAISLGACGDDATPDTGEVESDLARIVQEQTGTRDVRITCPDDLGEGDLCRVSAQGGVRAQVRVTQLDDGDVDGEIVQP